MGGGGREGKDSWNVKAFPLRHCVTQQLTAKPCLRISYTSSCVTSTMSRLIKHGMTANCASCRRLWECYNTVSCVSHSLRMKQHTSTTGCLPHLHTAQSINCGSFYCGISSTSPSHSSWTGLYTIPGLAMFC